MPRVFSPEQLAKGIKGFGDKALEDLAGREQDIQRGKTVELLRRAGKEMYENPIVNTAVGISPVLGDIQAGVEAYRSAQEGDWGNAGLNAMGMLPFIPMLGKTVWHGSPHPFTQFDMSKMGTGEGAQAYGAGHYLAEARPVAEGYQKALSRDTFLSPNGAVINKSKLIDMGFDKSDSDVMLNALKNHNGDFNAAADAMATHRVSASNFLRSIGNKGTMNEGYLYKVDLPDEQIAKMLDWDKPLTEQPEHIQEFVRNMDLTDAYGRNKGAIQAWKEGRDVGYIPKGQDVYNAMAGGKENDALASQMMYQQGIPGIQYLDQASRGAGDGTRNYVVFSDEIPQILERNNQPVGMFK